VALSKDICADLAEDAESHGELDLSAQKAEIRTLVRPEDGYVPARLKKTGVTCSTVRGCGYAEMTLSPAKAEFMYHSRDFSASAIMCVVYK
jgi:hypothetical protein